MSATLLAATSNRGKLAELRAILDGLGLEVLSPSDLGVSVEVEEDGETFAANALKKARAYHAATGLPVVADDSGLAVDALGGLPGVRTARYAGEGASDEENYRKLLRELENVSAPERGAAFVCAIALVTGEGEEHLSEGRLQGRITFEPRGAGGFGYDPVFELPGTGLTLAETGAGEKNLISHRAAALAGLKERIARFAS